MRVPTSTYRLQLDPAQLDLAGATRLVPYLDSLGVSHVFASPVLVSRPGSTHGYDVVDPTRIDPELGGREALSSLHAALEGRGMGIVLDIVPNHMAIGRHNSWWMEVLEFGPRTAPHGGHFDITAEPLLLPILGRPYAEALAERELRLVLEDGRVLLGYWEERFPLDAPSLAPLLEAVPGCEAPAAVAAADREPIARSSALAKEIHGLEPPVRTALQEELRAVSADPDRLHLLLDQQHYRLAWWQLSRERLGHRRFFTITELAGIRQESRTVFDDTHALTLELVRSGEVEGLRIDHIDGLRDPEQYLAWLAEETGDAYVVVEKILASGETLPDGWRVAGTTGYEYVDASAKAFVDPAGHAALAEHYGSFTGATSDFDQLVYDQRRFIIHERLGPETAAFSAALEALARRDRVARDALASDLIDAAIDVIASLPVYRTYARDGALPEAQRHHVEEAVELARRRNPGRPERVLEFLERLFLLDHSPAHDRSERVARTAFVERVQQFTGAVMAKGVEDTAFYQYNVLLALNEVGGHPSSLPADPVAAYHEHNAEVALRTPATMTAGSTHDTKRSEDVRARIGALSQVADSWAEKVEWWHERNRAHRSPGGVPVRNEEMFVYQTLVGAWPLTDGELSDDGDFGERIASHLVKAAREAKVFTEWLEPDADHERALTAFAAGIIADPSFVDDLESFAAPVWRAGALDSLAQTALRMAAPGVPDVYRGTEMWDLSLTDPDNRRPVDWDRLRVALAGLDEASSSDGAGLVGELARNWRDGRIKLHVVSRALRLRREWPEVFLDGEYIALAVHGPRSEHVVAFARRHGERWVIAVVPRLTLHLSGQDLWPRSGWAETRVVLPTGAPRRWTEILTGTSVEGDEAIETSAIFEMGPLGLLRSGPSEESHTPPTDP